MTPVKTEVLNLERDTAGAAEHQRFIVSGPNTELFVQQHWWWIQATEWDSVRAAGETKVTTGITVRDKRLLSRLYFLLVTAPHR